MDNIDQQSLTNELNRQNPWWSNSSRLAEDLIKEKRDAYPRLLDHVQNNDLITVLTGLRRVGKTTIIKQIINKILPKTEEKERILYYSFEEAGLFANPNLLEKIILSQIKKFSGGKLWFFFDEIQYVDLWNAILKKYFDLEPRLKFVLTGSSSLFIKTRAEESLAGRILETILPPLSFGEYLRLIKQIVVPDFSFPNVSQELSSHSESLENHFFEYLNQGEFPYLNKLASFDDRKQYVLDWIIGKIVANDIPKMRRFVHGATLISLNNSLIVGSGQLIEIKNLSEDFQIDRKTLSSYLSLLEKSFLIRTVFNGGVGFRARSVRTRKIYSTSVNAVTLQNTRGQLSESFNLKIGQIVENFVCNFLNTKFKQVSFWRARGKEIDFIVKNDNQILPIEVKYQRTVKREDLNNLIYYCRQKKLNSAILVTRNLLEEKTIDNIKFKFIPAHFFLSFPLFNSQIK
jgi:predicted AAA+ superfamily ATPase